VPPYLGGRLDGGGGYARGAGGTVVHQLLANYQHAVAGITDGSGDIRLPGFRPDGKVRVFTCSPCQNAYLTDLNNKYVLSACG
jgi:hypothetical protein